ncbi:MAG: transglycosylase SLT domain-containing protein [Bacteroidia bacterium]
MAKQLYILIFVMISVAGFSQQTARVDDPIAAMLDSMATNKILDKLYSKPNVQKNKYHYAPDSIPVCDEFVYENRLAKLDAVSPFDLQYNPSVKAYIELYTMRRRGQLSKLLGLSQLYYPLFEEILDKYNMPLELKHLAVIESALNPTARSRAGAVGLWQFMYPTAKMYNININSYIDERSDPYKATVAAAEYMQFLYSMFKDWQMVLAAYNAGPGTINRAIRRSGGKQTYWEIRPYLPLETQSYVPAFIGANYAMTYYAEHNVYPALPQKNYFELDTVVVKEPLTFEQLAQVLDISVEEIQYFNPVYKKKIIPSGGNILTLPKTTIGKFVTNEEEIYAMLRKQAEEQKLITQAPVKEVQVSHVVRKGENLSAVARKYGVTVADIKTWNLIGRKGLKPGRRLVIYKQEKIAPAATNAETKTADVQVADNTKTSENKQLAESHPVLRPSVYVVRKGDTFYKIALDFGLSVEDLQQLNGLKKNAALQVGQKLKVTK